MPVGREAQSGHADRHDLDKLGRWKLGLDAAADSAPFPVCAIFLVGPQDRVAHDIFRRYRSAFEELGGGFHHLVIFGQHGRSATLSEFLCQLGTSLDDVPLLALAPMDGGDAGRVVRLPLPKGDTDGDLDDSQPWGTALARIRAAASGAGPLSLSDDLDGAVSGVFRGGSLVGAVGAALRKLEGDAA